MKAIFRNSLSTLIFAAAATARVAHADPNNPTDNDKAAARPFAIEGLRLAQAGNCHDAVDKLERGEALVHAPTTAVPLAQCDIQLGKIIAGTEILNRVINETLPTNAPASWGDAKQQARGILDAAQPRIAKLHIHVDVPPGITPNPEVTVDGQPVPVVLLDNDRPTDPGQHHIIARQAGAGSAETDVTLADGQVKPVSLRLGPGGGAAMGAAPAPVQTMGTAAGTPDPYGQGAAAATSTSDPGGFPFALEFGARLAFGLPFGGVTGGNGNSLDHAVNNMIAPLWLEAGVRLASNWYVGSYFMYGVTSLSDQFSIGQLVGSGACKRTGVGCSGNDIRLGIDAAYHILPEGRFDPWFGVGFGYEWLSATVTADSSVTGGAAETINIGLSGWEFVNVQAGLDFRLLDGALGIGPFVETNIAQYSSQSTPTDFMGATTSGSVSNQTLHEWFLFGVRGDYDLKLH